MRRHEVARRQARPAPNSFASRAVAVEAYLTWLRTGQVTHAEAHAGERKDPAPKGPGDMCSQYVPSRTWQPPGIPVRTTSHCGNRWGKWERSIRRLVWIPVFYSAPSGVDTENRLIFT